MIRRIGAAPEREKRHRLRPGVYTLLPLEDQLLLTCQWRSSEPLQLPGGGIDPGEAPVAALHREVREETGWKIAAPRRIGAWRRFVFMPEYDLWAEKLCTIYVAHPVRPLGPPEEDGHEVIFVPITEAGKLLSNPVDRAALARALAAGALG
ncbi:NUDIX domain-containing protein [Marinovum sp.]|uniref:NUDIX domain-containing protein n=1 Tax=Marinovum sp. TaxID=2024839 RepID=UPI003A929E32